MKIIEIIFLFQLIKLSTFEIENINWKKYIKSDELNAVNQKIKSINGIEGFGYLKSINLKLNQIKEII